MATQSYRHKSDLTVSSGLATHPGNESETPVKTGGENKTPAPVKSAGEQQAIKDQAWGGAGSRPGGGNPGMNRYAGGVSLPPGVRGQPATIKADAPSDAVIEGLLRGGVAALDQQDPWQTRNEIDKTELPASFGHKHRTANDGSPGGQVSKETLLGTSGDAQARRDAALKRIPE